MSTKRTRKTNVGHHRVAGMFDQKIDPGTKRSLGQLNLPNIVLGDNNTPVVVFP